LCFYGGRGQDNRNAAIILMIIFFVFAFFVALFFAVRSAVSAREADRDCSLALKKTDELSSGNLNHQAPTFSPGGYIPNQLHDRSPSAPPQSELSEYKAQYIQGDDPLNSLYRDAAILLAGRRNERVFAACSQGLMATGAGVVTTALLIMLLIEPEIVTIGLTAGGIGVAGLGVALWASKFCCLSNFRQQEAADRISLALNRSS
jgi:hypothetical protein